MSQTRRCTSCGTPLGSIAGGPTRSHQPASGYGLVILPLGRYFERSAAHDDLEVVTDEYSFAAFGTLRSSTGSTANSQQYKGRLIAYRKDPNAGPGTEYSLHHRTKPRNRSLQISGLAKDDLNLYRYVKNNPVNRTDPSGFSKAGLTILLSIRENMPWLPEVEAISIASNSTSQTTSKQNSTVTICR